MRNQYVFLMVSLVDELEKVIISINKLKKLYVVNKFVVIVPEKDINKFKQQLRFNKNVEIYNENEIVNKEKFFNLCNRYLKNKKDFNSFRTSWYFQQVLKLTYSLSDNFFTNHNLVMWDADTIPIRKIEFFNKNNEPINYGSFYEYHLPYFEHNKILFGQNYKPFQFAATIQFYALNIQDRKDLRAHILNFNQNHNISPSKLFVGEAIIKGIEMQDKSISVAGQLVSEQELVGAFIFKKYKRAKKDQKIIKFFRFDVDGYLNKFQNLILYLFNYKHITYEWHYELRKSQSYKNLFKCILRDLIVSNNNSYNKFNKLVNYLSKFYKRIKKIFNRST